MLWRIGWRRPHIPRLSVRAGKATKRRIGLMLLGTLVACSGDANYLTGPSSNLFGTGTVTPSAVATIILNPPSVRGVLGTSMQLSVVAKDSAGHPLTDEQLTRASSDSPIVAISRTDRKRTRLNS